LRSANSVGSPPASLVVHAFTWRREWLPKRNKDQLERKQMRMAEL
jgi:hypothetical protein